MHLRRTHLESISLALATAFSSAQASSIALAESAPPAFDRGYLPAELTSLKEEISSVLAHTGKADPSEGQWLEALAAQETQTQKWFPVVSAQSGLSRSRTRYLKDDDEISNADPQTNLQFGFNLRQNIFSGGSDWKRQTLTRLKSTAALLQHIETQRKTLKQWLRELIQIKFYEDLVKFGAEAQQQAIQLNQLARRKEASGFLGKRELLDSEREVLRTLQELQSNSNKLSEMESLHLQKFGISNKDIIKRGAVDSLLKHSDLYLSAHPDQVAQKQLAESLPWLSAGLQKNIAAQEGSITTGSRFSPRIDATAGFNENRSLIARKMSDAEGALANRTQGWNLAVTGEVSLNAPTTFGAIEESAARLITAKQNESRVQRDILIGISSATIRLKQTSDLRQVAERLVTATGNVREQNRRLFEAGEISLDRLILSQQDLDRDRKSLVSAVSEENLLRLELALSALWQIPPSNNSTAALP